MESLPQHWPGLVAAVFLLGLRHGFDPDHLAAIDGLARYNAAARPRLARWSGLLFSLGHGAVVTAVALAAATVATGWRAPAWLEATGAWISIGLLALMGAANLRAVARTPRGEVVRPAGLRSRLFARVMCAGHPAAIVAVGAAFALSFDTIGLALVFSFAGSQLAGWPFAALLGLVFTAGMATSDALNGLWVAGLLRRAGGRAPAASRLMGLAIGLAALAIAALAAARHFIPALDEGLEGWGAGLGAAVAAFVLCAYLAATRWAAPAPAAQGAR